MLGVFFSACEPGPSVEATESDRMWRRFEIVADLGRAQLPVYFDFEGVWARLVGRPGVLEYPHSLPSLADAGEDARPLNAAEAGRLAAFMKPAQPRGTGPSPFRASPFFLGRAQRRLLETGLAERRTFLDPARVPPFRERGVERLAFVYGELNAGASPAALFRRLAAMKVLPFLFATDGRRVLFATLSVAPPVGQSEGRPAILANLERYLHSIEILRERVAELVVVIDHRYDRLFPSA